MGGGIDAERGSASLSRPSATRAFDVGETLVDESREWGEWADYLRVSRLSFHASPGAVIEKGQHHRRVFEIVRPGVDFTELRRERESAGNAYSMGAQDLYPDVVPLIPVFVRRGPWALIQSCSGRFAAPAYTIESLSSLSNLLQSL
ncbi:MAG: hypothetical protein V4771_15100 [Burkholderia cenocepacia]